MLIRLLYFLACLAAGGCSFNQFSSASAHHSGSDSVHSVVTPFGVVRGLRVSPVGIPTADDASLTSAVVQYLSIPYGSAPTGHHRFKMAISAPKWTHQPKEAFRPPPSCIQSGLPSLPESEALKVTTAQRFDRLHRILPSLKPQSEDCLFMNLFVPERREFRDVQPLPVIVLIHGDTDYGWGGANAYNGTLLASFGHIVVVTLNYRLGLYGFLGHCEPEALHSCAGNAGLSDLVAALKMLSLLLPSFGADPNAVTLLGWESGAALVSLLMASPITQPKGRLFRRAILLDGSALAPWAMADNPQEQFMQLAKALKCHSDERSEGNDASGSHQKESARILRCIQENSAQNLSNAARKVSNTSPTFLSTFAPLIDGQVVPNRPSLSFSPKFGALFREIDLLIGTVQHPAQHLIADHDMQHGLGTERRDKILRTLVRNIFDFHRTEILQAILNEYTDWENPKNHSKSIRNGLMAALGDLLFTAPLIETARAHSLDEGPLKAANTFFFVFAHETDAWMREQPNSGLRGSFTGDHLSYILGLPFTAGELNGGVSHASQQFSPEDKQLCRVLMSYIANFVKSGDPTRPQPLSAQSSVEDRFQGLPWPQFSAQTREAYLEITDRPRVKNYYKNSFVQFWSGFIPTLNRRGGKDVPEEHHFLPDHFDRSTFFGQPRPFSTYHNLPFPPPPMPPTPFPKELRNHLLTAFPLTTNQTPDGTPVDSTSKKSSPKLERENSNTDSGGGGGLLFRSEYNPAWGWLVLVGVALTAINLCILIAISKQCMRRRPSSSKKKFNYQSYAAPSNNLQQPLPGLDMNFAAMMGGPQCRRQRRASHQACLPTTTNNNNTSTKPFKKTIAMTFADQHLETDCSRTVVKGRGGGEATTNGNVLSIRSGAANRRQNSIGTHQITRASANAKIESALSVKVAATEPDLPPLMTKLTLNNLNKLDSPETKLCCRTPDDLDCFNSFNGITRNCNSGLEGSRAATSHLLLTYGGRSRTMMAEHYKQEPLLSNASSLKGGGSSNPSMVHQPPSTGLIRIGPGISPTCPRHGRAAQMLLAAAAANRTSAAPTIGCVVGSGNSSIPSSLSSVTTPPINTTVTTTTTTTTSPLSQQGIVGGGGTTLDQQQQLAATIGVNGEVKAVGAGGTGAPQQLQQRSMDEVQV